MEDQTPNHRSQLGSTRVYMYNMLNVYILTQAKRTMKVSSLAIAQSVCIYLEPK